MIDFNNEELKNKFIEFFKEFSKIPHPSYFTQEMLNYLKMYAEIRGYKTFENNKNLIIHIPATSEYESFEPVIIQGHVDMVAHQAPGTNHIFEKDPIKIIVYDNAHWMTADNTTLGADDGVAIVYMMMIMNGFVLEHPELFLIITSDEEVGLIGAKNLDPNYLKEAKYLINLDTEFEGVLSVGSAGGEAITGRYSLDRSETLGNVFELTVSDCSGGHAGGAISKNSLHAAKGLAQILGHLLHVLQIRIVSFEAKSQDNVITTSAKAYFITSADQQEVVDNTVFISRFILSAYLSTDPHLNINLKPRGVNKLQAFTLQSTGNIIFNTLYMPYGVETLDGTLITSSNTISNCSTNKDLLTIRTHLRFKSEQLKELVKNKIIQFFTFTNAIYEITDSSPAWQEKSFSILADKASRVWERVYGTVLNKVAGNGILECGVFAQKNPELDIISFGPTVENVHSFEEKLDLDSAVRVYKFLIELLKDMKIEK